MLPQNPEELEKIRAACRRMVTRRAAASAGGTLVPVPGLDVAADVGLLLELLPAINRKFGLTPDQIDELQPRLKVLLYGIIKKVGSELAGRIITQRLVIAVLRKVGIRMAAKQVLKYIPMAGQAAAAALSYAAMMYVGNAHVDECCAIVKAALDARKGS